MNTALSVPSGPLPIEMLGYETLENYYRDGKEDDNLRLALFRIESGRPVTMQDLLVFKRITGLVCAGDYLDPIADYFELALRTLVERAPRYRGHGYIFTHVPVGRGNPRGIQYSVDGSLPRFLQPELAVYLPNIIPVGSDIIFGYNPKLGFEMVFGKGATPT